MEPETTVVKDTGVDCELCGTPTVYRSREFPRGVEEWQCTKCGDFKRWCPYCNQGWIRRLRAPNDAELYSCDECEAAWASISELGSDGTDRQSVLRKVGAPDAAMQLTLVRERGP